MSIKDLGEKYGFEIRETNNVYIRSKYDQWYIEDRGNYFLLHHKNKKSSRDWYHLQTKYRFVTYEDVFNRIKEHDDYVTRVLTKKSRRVSRLDMLFNQISCSV